MNLLNKNDLEFLIGIIRSFYEYDAKIPDD